MAKIVELKTPVGIAVYPHLNKPDTAFNDCRYKVSIGVSKADAAAFKNALLEAVKGQEMPKNPDFPIKVSKDDPELYLISAKSKKKPRIMDSKMNRLPEKANVGPGSRIRALVLTNVYAKGVSLFLEEVQVIELKERKSGLDAFEGGYEYHGEFDDAGAATDSHDSEAEVSALDL